MRASDVTKVDWVTLIRQLVQNLVNDADQIIDENGVQHVFFHLISTHTFGIFALICFVGTAAFVCDSCQIFRVHRPFVSFNFRGMMRAVSGKRKEGRHKSKASLICARQRRRKATVIFNFGIQFIFHILKRGRAAIQCSIFGSFVELTYLFCRQSNQLSHVEANFARN